METLKRKVGRPRKNETTTLRNFENEILMTKEKIKELENNYYQSETSFNSRVDRIKDNMFNDYMVRRKIYEEEVERLTKKIVKKDTKKFVEGQIVVRKHWNNEHIFVLITKVYDGNSEKHYYWDCGGFKYNTIGVSGVGTKWNNHWFNDEENRNVEIVCDTRNFVKLCEKYGIKKPKLNKSNMEIIYENIFGKKLNDTFNYNDLHKLGIITK